MSQTIDAEIVQPETSQALVRRGGDSALTTVADLEQSFALAVRQRELLSEYIKKQLQPGKHYFQRGDQKPSLTKEGAEIILLPHNLAPDYEIVSGPEGPPADGKPYQITVKCTLRRKGDAGSFVGSGVGSAGSEKANRNGVYQPRQTDKYLCHNATLKMAQKSAMIAATINSTAASEFFTQDMDPDGFANEKTPTNAPGRVGTSHPVSPHPPKPQAGGPLAKPAAAPPSNKPTAPEKRYATAASRAWLVKRLEPCRDLATEYFRKLNNPAVLLPNENLEDLGLQFLPLDLKQAKALDEAITNFGNGAEAHHAFPPNELKPVEKPRAAGPPPSTPPAAQTPPPTRTPAQAPAPPNKRDPEWFWGIICPVPPKGVKKADYIKAPDTIRSLYTRMKEGDSEVAGKRLWGFANHYEPKPWTGNDGQVRQPSNAELVFREALDAFLEWHEKNGKDTVPEEAEPEPSGHDYSPQPGEDESVPF